jgi:O-antigen/teichoic acid export membrane protein
VNLSLNIAATLAARVLVLGLTLVSSVLLARLLGPDDRGLFALALLLPEWGKSLGLLGFDQANAVYAGLQPGQRRTLVWHSLATAAVVGGAVVGTGIAFLALGAPGIPALAGGPRWFFVLPLLTVPFSLTATYWSAVLRGMNRIVLLNALDVALKGTAVVLLVLLLLWGRLGVAGAVWADAIAALAGAVVLGAILGRIGAWGRPTFSRQLWKQTVRFALPAYGGMVAAYINYRADQLLVASILRPADLAFYVIAVGLAERLWLLTGAVANALLPHLTNHQQRDPALAAGVARHVMLWTAAGCLVVFLLSDVLVDFLFGAAFAVAAAPLRWLLPGIFTLSVGKVLVAELLAREQPIQATWATAVATLVNVAGNLALVPRLGISGAAVASSISYTLLSTLIIWCYTRETGVPWTCLVPRREDLLPYVVLWRRVAYSVGR